MTLKTTPEQIEHWLLADKIDRQDVIDLLLHDAREAHRLQAALDAKMASLEAARDWYKLLAIRQASGRLLCRNSEVRVLSHRYSSRCLFYSQDYPLDDDGLPIRTPEIEAALKSAKSEGA